MLRREVKRGPAGEQKRLSRRDLQPVRAAKTYWSGMICEKQRLMTP